jgi:hypothetical protein
MKTTEKDDIVYKEAFNVVKKDFCASLNHGENNLSTALGCENKQPTKEEFLYLQELLDLDTTTLAVEKLMTDSNNLNEFTHSLFLYIKLREGRKQMVNDIDELLGGIFSKLRKGDRDK